MTIEDVYKFFQTADIIYYSPSIKLIYFQNVNSNASAKYTTNNISQFYYFL